MTIPFNLTIEKLRNHHETKYLFKKNMFTNQIEFMTIPPTFGGGGINKGSITDDDILEFKLYLSKDHNLETTTQKTYEIASLLAKQNCYHPLKDYLDILEWDGTPRVDSWLVEICGCKDNNYHSEIGAKMLYAACKRIRSPGCKFDFMTILEGDQGIGKSTLLSILGGKWYLDTHLSTKENKQDIIDMMRTAWIVEISDLAGFKKNEIEGLKSFISRQVDRVRMPYARQSEDFPRQCIFIGTHNPSGDNNYFRDDTGNRRFWPVECGKIDLPKAREWRDQLWAEAYWKEPGQTIYLENVGSLGYLNELHKEREIDTPLNMMITEYINGKNMISSREIMEKVFHLDIGRISQIEARSKATVIGIWMKKNKWIRGSNDKRGWYFRPGHEYDVIEKPIETIQWED